ncbi:lytic transglycosylase domain-containing protein [Litorisediminicola beolgyonensis]|uniref:Lytic transglycosylase domain-containing protein n=1 Tax=Litorisediminicola beolgyonensis TaxID=1173614 RepID=A0ABW3ZDB8_9RHOB
MKLGPMIRVLLFCCLALLSLPAAAQPAGPGTLCSSGRFGPVQCIRPAHFTYDTCRAIETFSKAHDLPAGFFARLLWQESRFDPNAVSPAAARGIAQFIDSTAALRGLVDSYNPALAMEFSAEYLGELVRRFGNPGLAAVAYNGGEARAEKFIADTGGLPRETIDYVRIITGLTAWDWRDDPPEDHDFRLDGATPFVSACLALATTRRVTAFPEVAPRLRDWGVQVAFGATKKAAREKFERTTRACSGALKSERIDYVYEKSRASPKGGYYLARVGRDSRDAAWTFCSQLKARGCLCAVYRNR